MIESETFKAWMNALRDGRARAADCLAGTAAGIWQPRRREAGGGGLSELRIDYGPGYRVYFMQRGAFLVVVLCGGNKSTQDADIQTAKRIAKEWRY
ncbi:MAG TPA: type II toxin-antitoxin system RelE/ParE family toxin [Chiayiivirga sp.]|nr:type II toxin-antitoxin system RelE/ParE family toxin [Chiayiivirga sp.]